MGNKDLRIVIVGAGMGGLTCALACAKKGFKHIDVYESASDLGFVGAGIQLAPNMARILDGLGCWKDIEKDAVDLKSTKGDTDTELGFVDLSYIRETYHYPHMVGHRSSLAGSLYNACKLQPAITFHFSTTAETITSWTPQPIVTVRPRNGIPYPVTADILLGADGIKSALRTSLLTALHATASVQDTHQAAYRIMLPRSSLSHDPTLLTLLDTDRVTRWIGPQRHIIAYPVSSKTIYNLSTLQPDTNFAAAPSATYTTRGSKAALLRTFSDFCPLVQRLLALVPDGEVCEWKLRVHAPLPAWTKGCVALLGDACHPTLPHLAQGAAQAVEDAAVLAEVLDLVPEGVGPQGLARCLGVYERVRKERAERLVELAVASGRALHLGEGEAREERDRAFRELREKKGEGGVPDKWADADVQRMIYGHDCVAVAREEFARVFESL